MTLNPGSSQFGSSFLQQLTPDLCRRLAEQFDTPCRVYFSEALIQSARHVLKIPNAFGLNVRFAMKANPLRGVLQLFHREGIQIDASSQYEVRRALRAGIPAAHIQLTAQEWPRDDGELVQFQEQGVLLNPCSIRQLERFATLFPGADVGFRINPGLGSGGTRRTNTGGTSSSFGIWHEELSRVGEIVTAARLKVTRLHSHIGSGSDVAVWEHCADLTLAVAARLVRELPAENCQLQVLNLGGGYKVARMEHEKHTDIHLAFRSIEEKFRSFASTVGPKLKLEIEPGTFLVAHAGVLLSRVQDLVHTGAEGYRFLKLDSGMTELLRPSLYGAQHSLSVVPADGRALNEHEDYVVVGHCCESGDIFTTVPGSPEELQARSLPKARIGDFVIVGGAGAYAEGFCVTHYNSFPEPSCILLEEDGTPRLIRQRSREGQESAGEADL